MSRPIHHYYPFVEQITGFDSSIVKWCYIYLATIGILTCVYLILAANEKLKQITNPRINNSYCIISVHIVKMVIINMGFQIIIFMFQIFVIFDKTLVYNSIDIEDMHKQTKIYIAYQIIARAGSFINSIIVFTQKYEWVCMLNIISYQKNKSLSEIIYEFQNTDIKLNFLRKESYILFGFVCLNVIKIFSMLADKKEYYYSSLIVNEAIFVFMLMVFFFLLKNLKEFYHFEYQTNKKIMIFI